MRLRPASTEFGDDCLLCFDAGKTPLHMKVFLAGIIRSPHWNPFWKAAPNGYIDVTQSPINPCAWHSPVAVYPRANFHMHVGGSTLQVWTAFDVMAFLGEADEACVYWLTNKWVGQFPMGFQDGSASISIPGTASGGGGNPPLNISAIINSITPMIGDDPRISCHPVEDGKVVIGYSDIIGNTSIKILFDTTP